VKTNAFLIVTLSSVAFVFTVLLIGDGTMMTYSPKEGTRYLPSNIQTSETVSLWSKCELLDSVDEPSLFQKDTAKSLEFPKAGIYGSRTMGVLHIVLLFVGSFKVMWLPATILVGLATFLQMVYMSLVTTTVYNKIELMVRLREELSDESINFTGWSFIIGWINFVLLSGATVSMLIYGYNISIKRISILLKSERKSRPVDTLDN